MENYNVYKLSSCQKQKYKMVPFKSLKITKEATALMGGQQQHRSKWLQATRSKKKIKGEHCAGNPTFLFASVIP